MLVFITEPITEPIPNRLRMRQKRGRFCRVGRLTEMRSTELRFILPLESSVFWQSVRNRFANRFT